MQTNFVEDILNSCSTQSESVNICSPGRLQRCECKCGDVCAELATLKDDQSANNQCIRTLSESVISLSDTIMKLQSDMNLSKENIMQRQGENNTSPDEVRTSDLNSVSEARNFNSQINNVVISQDNNNGHRVSPENNPSLNRVQTPKYLVPCPFLRRRGHCLKGSNCDFFHDE